MEESNEQNKEIPSASLSILINLLLKNSDPRNLASKLRKIAEHIGKTPTLKIFIHISPEEQTPLQGSFIPSEDLEKIIGFNEKEDYGLPFTEENTEDSKDYEQTSLLTHKNTYSHGICTKRLRCSQIFDTHEEYDIDLEEFIVKTVFRNSKKTGLEYYEEIEEETSFCQKFKEDIAFHYEDYVFRMRENLCLHSNWCQTIMIGFGCILIAIISLFLYIFYFK